MHPGIDANKPGVDVTYSSSKNVKRKTNVGRLIEAVVKKKKKNQPTNKCKKTSEEKDVETTKTTPRLTLLTWCAT